MERQPEPGILDEIEPGVRRILAPNPSPMTHWGTNTYLIGTRNLAVIDPGPDIADHLAAIRAATAGARITHILITHAHRDHSALAPALSRITGAPVLAFGPPGAGRSAVMDRLAADGLTGGGEGVDTEFAPDRPLSDGAVVAGPGWEIVALWTPGHFAGHLSFGLGDLVFTGDHVMGWASTLISPPDGDLTAFLASCDRLSARAARRFLPGHGAPVEDPSGRLAWLVAHRRAREAAILAALNGQPQGIAALTRAIYTDTPEALMAAAERNVFAHLIALVDRGHVRAEPRLSADARFRRV